MATEQLTLAESTRLADSGRPTPSAGEALTVAGLFAGIGGIEAGLHLAGHVSELLCEIDPFAQAVLRARFPGRRLLADVRTMEKLPAVDLLAAGFPCQDLSQAGRTAGIGGRNSSLIGQVFRLVGPPRRSPRWLLLENVPFMLQLDRGRAMRFLVESLEERGFRWAYRVIDARAFGLPQRRRRVILLASRTEDPRDVLLADEAGERRFERTEETACGFYWTEGLRGLGWAVDAVPTLKGGSTIGIPSPPGIWFPVDGRIVVPDLRDAERLQGFEPEWTLPAEEIGGRSRGGRWKLVGNAVSVPVAQWIGERLARPGSYDPERDAGAIEPGRPWPTAAWGDVNSVRAVDVSAWPRHEPYRSLAGFLEYEPSPLSARATEGFLGRTRRSSLRFEPRFLAAVAAHLRRMGGNQSSLVSEAA